MVIFSIISISAGLLFVASYALLQRGLTHPTSALYLGMNLLASLLALIGLWQNYNHTVLICNGFWLILTCISIYEAGKKAKKSA